MIPGVHGSYDLRYGEPVWVPYKTVRKAEPETSRRCSLCRRVKPLTEFYKNRAKHLGRGYECCECKRKGGPLGRPRKKGLTPR